MKSKSLILFVAGVVLLCLCIGVVSASTRTVIADSRASVFIGEEGLDISPVVGSYNYIAFWPAGSTPNVDSPTVIIYVLGRKTDFLVSAAEFAGYDGNYYVWDGSNPPNPQKVFTVVDPALGITIWNPKDSVDEGGKSVARGTYLTFRIATNMYHVAEPSRTNAPGDVDEDITIKVRDPSSAEYTQLYDSGLTAQPLTGQFPNSHPFYYWGGNTVPAIWATGAAPGGVYAYASGTYTVWAESTLNHMKDNYLNGGAVYTGKTVSNVYTVTLVGDPGKVSVLSNPSGATIWIDDFLTGAVTPATIDVSPGSHYVRVSRPNYYDQLQLVIAPSGGTVEAAFTLSPSPMLNAPPTVSNIIPPTGGNAGVVASSITGTQFAPSGVTTMLTPVNANPVHKGSITDGTGGADLDGPQYLFVSGNYAYVTSFGGNALEIVDITDPANPVHSGSITDGGGSAPYLYRPASVFVSGDYAYVVGESNALEIIDVSNHYPPFTYPVHVGSIVNGAGGANLYGPIDVFVKGSYAYVTSAGGHALEIVDISNPAAPVHVSTLSEGFGGAQFSQPWAIYIAGNYAYITSNTLNTLEIVDISDPVHPYHEGSIKNGDGGALLDAPVGVFVSGNYAYVTSPYDNALEIIDVSNPAAPVHKSSITNSGGALLDSPRGVYVFGNYAYVTSYYPRAGLEIVDVTDPENPVHKSSIMDGAGGALLLSPMSVFVSGNYAYVTADSENALEIVDIGTVTGTESSHTASKIEGSFDLTGKAPGLYNVVVTNPGGSGFGTLASGFTITAPDGDKTAAIDYGKTFFDPDPVKAAEQELSISDQKADDGTVITLLDGTTRDIDGTDITNTLGKSAWVEYVNIDKDANYGHPGKIVFYADATNSVAYDVMMPPTGIAFSHAAGYVPDPVGVTQKSPPYVLDPACSPVTTNNYALLISGGGTKDTNYARYYNDIKFMYNTLVTDFKYDKTHIKVLLSDDSMGTGKEDQVTGYTTATPPVAIYADSNLNLDGDATVDDVYGPATKANVIAALKTFTAGTPAAPIDLLIFTTGHGAANQLYSDPSTNPVDLLLWGVGEKISDTEFVNNLPANARISMMMEQCNGGGFKNEFIPASGLTRVLATAAQGNQASHSNDFSYYWITGVAGHDSVPPPNTHSTNADADGSFQVSMYEAYNYANKADPSGPSFGKVETPTFNQFGASAGASQFFSTCINEYSIPVATPSAALNGGSAYTITWTTPKVFPSLTNVKIDLMKGPEPGLPQVSIIDTRAVSFKSFPWSVPTSLNGDDGTDYWIRISTIGGFRPITIGRSNNFEIRNVGKSGTADLTIQSTPTDLPIVLKDANGITVIDKNGATTAGFTTGPTGHMFSLFGGTYYVSLSKPCYQPLDSAKVTLVAGNSQIKPYTLLAMKQGTCDNSLSGSIEIISEPKEGFRVFIDGTNMQYDTPVFQDIDSGVHTVRLELSGYVTQEKTDVVVEPGKKTTVIFTLKEIPKVPAQVQIVPKFLNIGRTGYFLAIVKLPTGYKAADVDAGSVYCENAKALKLVRFKLFPQLFVAIFSRKDLGNYPTGTYKMNVWGAIKKNGENDVPFLGSDTVTVINQKVTTKEDVDGVMTMTDIQIFTKFNKF